MTNSYANMMNSLKNMHKSIAKASDANVMKLCVSATNSTAKVPNSTANGTPKVIKLTCLSIVMVGLLCKSMYM